MTRQKENKEKEPKDEEKKKSNSHKMAQWSLEKNLVFALNINPIEFTLNLYPMTFF